ncbi:MAG: hypothetical protein QGG83_00410 [Candidatus Woesearchaeota archaeon]|nr:hypothetical protein [Candidatus Woesearchaeota archaeon]MDP7181526.1 hypothetical protein [Candidatus Woesearchaeota archaeon]MDP7466690.1 hypothetical protein [Candidatus Woesearchaeota archaeon]MDP7647207.1 hypothetical protein [Candidatus Woesearchaeota archaeon]
MLNRRNLCKTGALGILGSLGGFGCTLVRQQAAKDFKTGKRAATQQYSIAQIFNEQNTPTTTVMGMPVKLNYRGFPAQTTRRGFSVQNLTQKGTAEEAIVFAEDHVTSPRGVRPLVDRLASHYGFDSVAVEGYIGDPSTTLVQQTDEVVRTHLGDTFVECPGGHQPLTNADGSFVKREDGSVIFGENLVQRINPVEYADLYDQKILPTFGIEDKDVFLKTRAVDLYVHALFNILQLTKRKGGIHRFHKFPKITMDALEEVLNRTRERNGDVDLPHFCPYDFVTAHDINAEHDTSKGFHYWHDKHHEQFGAQCPIKEPLRNQSELREHRATLLQQYEDLLARDNEYTGNKRNDAWQETIPAIMRDHGFKKTAIIVGRNHAFVGKKPRVDEDKLLQNVLPFSTFAVNAT